MTGSECWLVKRFPRIARQTRHDVVGSAAGCRIDEHLAQRPTEASSGHVTPNHPEIGPMGYADLDITLSDREGGENAHRDA
jgi:hypothetical protein